MLLETARRALARRNIKWLLTRLENHFESKQISFYSNPDKVFQLLECQAKLFLVFSVTSFKIDQNKNQNLSIVKVPILKKERKVNMQRLSPSFRSQQIFLCKICGETFYQIFEICMETQCWCPFGWDGTVYHKTKNSFGAKFCMNISFQLFLYIMKVKYQEDQ